MQMNYTYKGKLYQYTIEDLGQWVEEIESDWIRISCEEVGLKAEFLKEDLQEALEVLKLYINMNLEEDYTSTEMIHALGRQYKAKIHWLGRQQDGQVWVRVVCKGARYHQKHPKSDLQTLFTQTLPALITAQQVERKTATFQIRLTPSEKLKISTLAKQAGLTITDYLLKQALPA